MTNKFIHAAIAPVLSCLSLALLLDATSPSAQAQTLSAADEIHTYLNQIGFAQLTERANTVAALNTEADADARQQMVRQKIIELVGGIPNASGPVVVREFGHIGEEGFSIENIAYESLPGYWVTANVYIPDGQGPFPALVIAPGHGAGKSSQYSWGANFASAGILVLAIDPMGQGERLQHFDAELGTSKVEPSGEHEHANQSALLTGKHIARYWFADGIRGVDYLSQRADVAANRIGTFGCSGGGTAAAYLAAMDDRIRVAAVASFITSFEALLPGNGPQDAEQTLPSFLSAGLDFADWIELVAPRPFAIFGFEEDFFPIAGTQWSYEEAKKFYALYDAEEQLSFIHGQGGHCNLGPVTPQLLSFLFKHLSASTAELPEFSRRTPNNPESLLVTPTGQLATSSGSDTVEQMLRREALPLIPPASILHSETELTQLQARVRADVRRLAAVTAMPDQVPQVHIVSINSTQQLENYQLQTLTLESEPGINLEVKIGVPNQAGPRPVVVWMEDQALEQTVASADFERLVLAGNLVVVFHPRGVLGPVPRNNRQLALGQYMPELLRAIVVGKTLVGMRVDDNIQLLNYLLSTRADIDVQSVTLYGRGALGMVALHAAAIDTRITHVVAESALLSYRTALEAGLHKNLSEVVIPDVLNYYDTNELIQASYPRQVTLVNPANAMGQTVLSTIAKEVLKPAIESDNNLGTGQRIQILQRNVRGPLLLGN